MKRRSVLAARCIAALLAPLAVLSCVHAFCAPKNIAGRNQIEYAELTSDEIFETEEIEGAFLLSYNENVPQIDLLTEESLFGGTRLTVPPLTGEIIDDEAYARETVSELETIFGSVYDRRILPYIRCRAMLNSEREMARYKACGVSIRWGTPDRAYYSLSCRAGRAVLSAAGEKGRFHCVSVAVPVAEKEVFTENGALRFPTTAQTQRMMDTYFPKLKITLAPEAFQKRRQNVYNVRYADAKTVIRCGIRKNPAAAAKCGYFYVLRADRFYRSH